MIVTYSTSAERFDALLMKLALWLVAATLACGAVSAWSALLVARLALRPLHHTARQIGAIDERHLDRRIDATALPAELAPTAGKLNEMLARLEGAFEQRTRFLSDASHELRTPVANIRGHAELALRHRGPVPAGIRHALERIQSESRRMTHLVDDLLLLARLDAGRPLEHEEVDLTRLVLDAVDDARAAGPGHRWLLDLPEEPVLVPGDGHRLQQALGNLLANARTHTPAGTEVTVALTPDTGNARLTVSDNGPGIPAELQPEVFTRFVRADQARSRSTGSTGLGLAIVHAIVTAHHGTVELTSRPGHTAFRVTLRGRPG
jgi:two-component system OmpR family sensor kinase